MSDAPAYPDIHVRLVGEDSNTGSNMGRVTDAMARHGVSAAERNAFRLAVLDCESHGAVLRLVGETVSVDHPALN